MCAGAIIYATGIRKINQLSGMAKKMPFVAVCFFVAAFSISGVPFFNGFISKTITIAAASAAGYDWVYTLLELASIGTFLSITLKMGYFIFLRDADKNVEIKILCRRICISAWALAQRFASCTAYIRICCIVICRSVIPITSRSLQRIC